MTIWFKRGISWLFTAMMLCILAMIVVGFDHISFANKRAFLLDQGTMLLLGMAGLTALAGLAMHRRKTHRADGKKAWTALLFWIALLGIQWVLCFHAYFMTGWDVRAVLNAAYYAAGGESYVHVNEGYFSMYPNNIPLVILFSVIIRLLRFILGNPGLDRCVFVIIAGQCVLNTFTGILCSGIVKRETGSDKAAGFAALVYAVFVGISPWLMITYSDSIALVFPTLTLALYQRFKDRLAVWPAIGACCALGYLIKPQAMIVFIAILIVECIHMLDAGCLLPKAKRLASAAAVLMLVILPGSALLKHAMPMKIDPDKNMGMLHFAMMGLNTETNGVYSDEDVVFSSVIDTPTERKRAQIQRIRERVSQMYVGEMADHLTRKMMTNYADGTFAWGCEGNFYREWIADKDEVLSPFLKTLIDTGNRRYLILQTYFHCIWLALLLGSVLCVTIRFDTKGVMPVLMLSIIGLTLFELIFEARARYLYLYAPFYVMLGVQGIWMMVSRIRRRET